MLTDRLLGPNEDENEDEHLDGFEEQYADLLDAARRTDKPALICLLAEDGLEAWENASEGGGIDKLLTIFVLLSLYIADRITEENGDDACAAFFARLVAGAVD